jgi:hypothetical protein
LVEVLVSSCCLEEGMPPLRTIPDKRGEL